MTNAIALSIHQVSKKYKLFNSPQERVWEALHPFKKKFHRDFWALKEVSLQIQKGQTLGIIGRNGSGKSTLLQLMAGVLKPTSGTIEVSGRISALLELGAGFNPEFTGRENIRFYGLLMGLSDVEIKNKIPEIETFADIGEFIDQPVKIYSSGMFVRLAFSAAIHVDPDILIIDEALAVGDAKFQHKCYQKFREFQEQGKTIIFVTHDMHAILKHCDHAFLMEAGSIVVSGKPSEVVHHYHELILNNRTGVEKINSDEKQKHVSQVQTTNENSTVEQFLKSTFTDDQCPQRKSYNPYEYRFGDKRGQIIDYLLVCQNRVDTHAFATGETIDLYIKARFQETVDQPLYGFLLRSMDGIAIYGSNTRFFKTPLTAASKDDIITIRFTLKLDLQAGDYFLDLGLAEKLPASDVPLDIRESALHIYIQSQQPFEGFVSLETSVQEVSVLSPSTSKKV